MFIEERYLNRGRQIKAMESYLIEFIELYPQMLLTFSIFFVMIQSGCTCFPRRDICFVKFLFVCVLLKATKKRKHLLLAHTY